MRLQVAEDLDPLQFAYQKDIEVDMLHRAYAYLDVPGSYVRIMFFDGEGVQGPCGVFNGCSKKNCLPLNTTKTKELLVDFRRSKTPLMEGR